MVNLAETLLDDRKVVKLEKADSSHKKVDQCVIILGDWRWLS